MSGEQEIVEVPSEGLKITTFQSVNVLIKPTMGVSIGSIQIDRNANIGSLESITLDNIYVKSFPDSTNFVGALTLLHNSKFLTAGTATFISFLNAKSISVPNIGSFSQLDLPDFSKINIVDFAEGQYHKIQYGQSYLSGAHPNNMAYDGTIFKYSNSHPTPFPVSGANLKILIGYQNVPNIRVNFANSIEFALLEKSVTIRCFPSIYIATPKGHTIAISVPFPNEYYSMSFLNAEMRDVSFNTQISIYDICLTEAQTVKFEYGVQSTRINGELSTDISVPKAHIYYLRYNQETKSCDVVLCEGTLQIMDNVKKDDTVFPIDVYLSEYKDNAECQKESEGFFKEITVPKANPSTIHLFCQGEQLNVFVGFPKEKQIPNGIPALIILVVIIILCFCAIAIFAIVYISKNLDLNPTEQVEPDESQQTQEPNTSQQGVETNDV